MQNKVCVCCGNKTLDPRQKFYEICPVCGWEDDPIQNGDPDYAEGANHISLSEAKQAFVQGKSLQSLKQGAIQRQKHSVEAEVAV